MIVVPYMGKSGMDFCQEHDLSWIDLSGNAHIKAPRLLIHVEGRKNRFKSVGRPANVFAPKSARIVRLLLIESGKGYNQREISQITGLDEGHTSRIVRRLEELNLIDRDDQGSLRPSDPNQLLDAWLETYDFSKHQIIKGHVAARSGEELLKRMSQILAEQKIDYAATGLAGAWQYTHFAMFRLTTFFIADTPGKNLFDFFISVRTIVVPTPGWLFPTIKGFSMDRWPVIILYVSIRYKYTLISRGIRKERKKLPRWFARKA